MRLGLIGNYGATNVGDDAILQSLLRSLDDHELVIFSANPDMWRGDEKTKAVSLFPLRFSAFFMRAFREAKEALKSVQVVILGGGGLFCDEGFYAFMLWVWQIFWIKRFKKPLYIYGAGVGPLKTWWGRWLTRWAYSQADVVTVRDDYSADLLRQIGVKTSIQVAADPVFLQPDPVHDAEVHQLNAARKGVRPGLIMISLRPWSHYDPVTISCFKAFLSSLQDNKTLEFVFVCMQSYGEDDLKLIQPVLDEVGGELFIPESFSQLLERMHEAEFAVGMRYHFMIAAILTSTPLLPVSYSSKTESLFVDSPLFSHVLSLDKLSDRKLLDGFKSLSVMYNNAVIYQRSLAKKYTEKAQENCLDLMKFIKRVDQFKAK